VVNYEKGLTFMTVHGSGHMVPQFRPRAALHMITNVVKGKIMSPTYVNNTKMGEMTDAEFDAWLDEWTTAAKKGVVGDDE
jgi:cathepsin A (carboxypeptidase C)